MPQSKVSIVIPCYNKADEISIMFDAIINQTWNNIEIVLVNDGSTDDTRKIISEYESKFYERGYEVVIIDQENKGLSGAVKSGLERFSGDYVCSVDADDSINSEYIAAPAAFLDANLDYDWTACEIVIQKGSDTNTIVMSLPDNFDGYGIEKLKFLGKYPMGVWSHLIRTSYFKKCNVLDSFYDGREGTQEPQFLVPLSAGGGRVKYIAEARYYYNLKEAQNHHSNYIWGLQLDNWENDLPLYYSVPINAVKNVHIQKRMYFLAICCIFRVLNSKGWNKHTIRIAKTFVDAVNENFSPHPHISHLEDRMESVILFEAVKQNLLGEFTPETWLNEGDYISLNSKSTRIVVCGALGARGARFVEMFISLELTNPLLLWDKMANETSRIMGIPVTDYDIKILREDDIILVCPLNNQDILDMLKDRINNTILNWHDIWRMLGHMRFNDFLDGTMVFKWNTQADMF